MHEVTTYKQVIVVRTDLNMGKGKLAGQVAHAAVTAAIYALGTDACGWTRGLFDKWFEDSNQTKVVCKVGSDTELEELARRAKDAKLIVARIHDAGHTQLEPGTFTCIAIGPDEASKIDAITGDLKLL